MKIRSLQVAVAVAFAAPSSPLFAGEKAACALLAKAEVEQEFHRTFAEPKQLDQPPNAGATLSTCYWRTSGAAGATETLTVMERVAPAAVPDALPKVLATIKEGGASVSETTVAGESALWSSRTTPRGLNGELHVFKSKGAVYLMVALLGAGSDQELQTRAKALATIALARAGQ